MKINRQTILLTLALALSLLLTSAAVADTPYSLDELEEQRVYVMRGDSFYSAEEAPLYYAAGWNFSLDTLGLLFREVDVSTIPTVYATDTLVTTDNMATYDFYAIDRELFCLPATIDYPEDGCISIDREYFELDLEVSRFAEVEDQACYSYDSLIAALRARGVRLESLDENDLGLGSKRFLVSDTSTTLNVGYYKGTRFSTGVLPITTRMYQFGQHYECQVFKTKEGYFIIDTSSLPAGKYVMEDGSLGWPAKYLINITGASYSGNGSSSNNGNNNNSDNSNNNISNGGNSYKPEYGSGAVPVIGEYCRIDDPGANVRSGPGTEYGKVGMAPNNGWYRIVGYDRINTKKDWYQIDLDGMYCWIYSDLVYLNGLTDGTIDCIPVNGSAYIPGGSNGGGSYDVDSWPIGATGYIPDNGNNIRSGPSRDYGVVAVANKGATFVILDYILDDASSKPTNRDWYYVEYARDCYGWIASGVVDIGSYTQGTINGQPVY